jgi:hypothetical protein
MRRWFRFSRTHRLIMEAICVISTAITGYKFIRFELGLEQPNRQPPKMEEPSVRKRATELLPTLSVI